TIFGAVGSVVGEIAVEALASHKRAMEGIEGLPARFLALHEAGALTDDLVRVPADEAPESGIGVQDCRTRQLSHRVRDDDARVRNLPLWISLIRGAQRFAPHAAP